MTEKLIPFDLEAYKREPERLRWFTGSKPRWSEFVRDWLIVKWDGGPPISYGPNDYGNLRLAAKKQKVKVWLVKDPDDHWRAITDQDITRDRDWGISVFLGEHEVLE